MKEIFYYNSPIGILRLSCSEFFLEELSYVKKIEENSKELSTLALICKSQLDEYFNGKLKQFSLPLKFTCGTTFQKNTWNALLDIKYAETKSYKDIAFCINNPKAVRAVGGANNKNPIAIIVPCHRVIGSSGKLVGYAGGLDIKQWLLKHEQGNKT